MNKEGAPRIRQSHSDVIVRAACKVICILFLIIFTVPLVYVLISSVYYRGEWSLGGYRMLLENKLVITGLRNSVFLAGMGTMYSLCLEIPAAYVLSKRRFRKMTNVFFVLGQFGVAILPLYLLLKQMHLLNTLWALILPCGVSVYYTQLLRARMLNASEELEDAAMVDGADALVYLVRIMVPVLGPSVGCIAFFHACSYWSSTFFAQTFLTEESMYPLSVVLMELLIKNRSTDVLLAGTTVQSVMSVRMAEFGLCVLSTLPPVAIFLIIRKNIRALETEGGAVL